MGTKHHSGSWAPRPVPVCAKQRVPGPGSEEAHIRVQDPRLSPVGPGDGASTSPLWTSVSARCVVCRLCPHPRAPLRLQLHWLDIAPREEADASAQPAPPPVGVEVLQDLNDVTAVEAEL